MLAGSLSNCQHVLMLARSYGERGRMDHVLHSLRSIVEQSMSTLYSLHCSTFMFSLLVRNCNEKDVGSVIAYIGDMYLHFMN